MIDEAVNLTLRFLALEIANATRTFFLPITATWTRLRELKSVFDIVPALCLVALATFALPLHSLFLHRFDSSHHELRSTMNNDSAIHAAKGALASSLSARDVVQAIDLLKAKQVTPINVKVTRTEKFETPSDRNKKIETVLTSETMQSPDDFNRLKKTLFSLSENLNFSIEEVTVLRNQICSNERLLWQAQSESQFKSSEDRLRYEGCSDLNLVLNHAKFAQKSSFRVINVVSQPKEMPEQEVALHLTSSGYSNSNMLDRYRGESITSIKIAATLKN